MDFARQIKTFTNAPITRHLLLEILQEYDQPNDKISELIKKGELISLRRGLYAPGPNLDLPRPESFLIANHLRGPSYVSLESALSYWNLIPERAFEVSSVTTKTSKQYITSVGRFSYKHLPLPYYAYGVRREELSKNQMALIASPEKAICDKIVLTPNINLRSVKQTQSFLLDDLRMDRNELQKLNVDMIHEWLEVTPKKRSIEMFVSTLEKL